MTTPSITTGRSSHNHPTNSSHTKYAYPFSKTKRFPEPSPPCPEAFYAYESQLSHRKAAIGYGKKTDFAALLPRYNPPANHYNIEPPRPRGLTFGTAREQSPDRSYLVPQLHRLPGPAQYKNQVLTQMPQKYSIRSKTIDIMDKTNTSHYTPGPAAYEPLDFQNVSGRHQVSKYTDSKFGTIDPSLERFPQIKQAPGPASYYNEGGEFGTGRYTLSRHQGGGTRAFSKEARFTGEQWRPKHNPSPANYDIATEFGVPDKVQLFL